MLEIPLAYYLALRLGGDGLGPRDVYWSIVVAESMAGVVGIYLFRQGRWKSKVV